MLLELITAAAIGYDQHIDIKSTRCMSEAVYFEARNQPIEGQVAVAITILNRVGSTGYPNNVCDVVYQPNQFSYTLMPLQQRKDIIKPKNAIDKLALQLSVQISLQALSGGFDGMHISQHYYNPAKADPKWAYSFDNSFTIADHKWVY